MDKTRNVSAIGILRMICWVAGSVGILTAVVWGYQVVQFVLTLERQGGTTDWAGVAGSILGALFIGGSPLLLLIVLKKRKGE